ncbi:hypothetical protein F01_420855 [Burkholderia cenocepacia]|nr:hypothetical protein F01_420855 [Burkholderia cenocepacia]
MAVSQRPSGRAHRPVPGGRAAREPEAARHAAAAHRARSARTARGGRRAARGGRARVPHAGFPDRARRFRRGPFEPRADLAAEPGHREARPDHAVACGTSHGTDRDPARARDAVARGRQAGARRRDRDRARSADRAVVRGRFRAGLLLRPAGAGAARQRGRDRLHRRADRALSSADRSARAARHAAARAVPARVRTGGRAPRGRRAARRGVLELPRARRGRALFPARCAGPAVGPQRRAARGSRAGRGALFAAGGRAGRELAAPAVFPLGDRRTGARAGHAAVPVDQRGAAVRDAVGGRARRRCAARAVRRHRLGRRRRASRVATHGAHAVSSERGAGRPLRSPRASPTMARPRPS